MQKNRISFALVILGIFLMLGAVICDRYGAFSMAEIAQQGSDRISMKAARCQQALAILEEDTANGEKPGLSDLFNSEKIGVYLFRHDSIVYWNNAQVPVEKDAGLFKKPQGLVRLRQGYYLYIRTDSDRGTAVALCMIKPVYDLQNNYLKNDFLQWTGIPREIDIQFNDITAYPILLNNEKLFSLKGNDRQYYADWTGNLCTVLFIMGFLLFLMAILTFIKNGMSSTWFIVCVAIVPALKFLIAWLHWPSFFYRSILYDVRLFGNAQSLTDGYLGDILLNAFTFLFVAAALHLRINNSGKKTAGLLRGILLFAFIFLVVNRFNHTVISLVNNSTINFDFLSIFSIKFPAFIGLGALSIYSLALFVAINKAAALFKGNMWPGFLSFLACNAAVCIVQQLVSGTTQYYESCWLILFSAPLFLLVKFRHSKISWNLGLQILIMSVVTSVFLNFYIQKNQSLDLRILSQQLSERRDEILESEFAGIPARINTDKDLNFLFNIVTDVPTAEKEIQQSLTQKFFGGYFNRYTIDFSMFDKDCKPLLSTKKAILLNEGFFDDQIKFNSDSTPVKGLFFVKNYRKNSRYIGKLDLGDKNLYVMLEPKQFEELGSFPDLLLDQSQQKHEKLKSFSYAIYRGQQNTSRYGDFNYPFFAQDSAVLASSNPQLVHYYFHQPDENIEIVISQKARNWNYFFTFNSYLLLFFSLVSYFCYLIYAAVFTSQFQSSSLTRRIQTIIVVLLLVAMSAVGITSGRLVTRQFETNNKKQLSEKTEIIINELAVQFSPADLFDESQKALVNMKLKEYARLFNTDISLFNKNGYLFNTSEPKLYELGLAATLANPKAYNDLALNRISSASVNEKAGTLKYLSLYTPLFDDSKQLIGFINLPYFAKQSDLVNELSGIISALINVYVILFVISIVAGLVLSGYITQPLRLIKQQIANITLGRQNEKIIWQSNDEIGKLVFEYNEMLVKLERSATLLAQSERESAWREMAKQVAHEIKNPLTPMKLNLQYLQHLMKHNPDDFKEKFERASAGIIEQIDALASIATEFSNFAKLPGARLQVINLAEIISSSVLIFDNQKNVSITNRIAERSLPVKGDKDQCLRVFNNILKNAVQALDGVAGPYIEISIEQHETSLTVLIKDNGCGIAGDLQPKIFTPNFTTKTTGSGLGLAMVKNIMQGFGGTIAFESEEGKGTTFFLTFEKSDAGAEA